MIKKQISNLDITVYHEILNNGLNVYIVPQPRNETIALYTTKYGSSNNEFVPIGENKAVKFPLGIAHFLEHKNFAQQDGIDPFHYFEDRGCYCNAFTSKSKTTYLFQGIASVDDNINYLLNFVDTPYFTDENVLKEKGIITQEIKMYLDNPWNRLYNASLETLLQKDDYRYPIAGTVEEINKITKEDLYKCYNTFYHPKNMFLIIVGNVDPHKIINVIKKNQSKRSLEPMTKIKQVEIKEPLHVFKKKETIIMPVQTPKVSVNYKVPILKNIPLIDQLRYLGIMLEIKFGDYSEFLEKLQKQEIINGSINYQISITKDYFLILLSADVNNIDEYVNLIKKQMKEENVTEDLFNLIKKTRTSSFIYSTENISGIVYALNYQIITYGDIVYDAYNIDKNAKYNECLELIKQMNFSENNIVIIDNKK